MSRPSILRTGFVALLASLFVMGYGLSFALRTRAGREEPLQVLPGDLDFGEQLPVQAFEWKVPLRNTSSAAIQVSSLTTSCNCSRIQPTGSFVVPPRGSVGLTFFLDLTSVRDTDTARDVVPFAVMFRARTSDSSFPEGNAWTLRGVVKMPIAVSPRHFAFCGGHRLIVGTKHPTFTAKVINKGPSPLALSAHCDPTIGLCVLSEHPDGSRSLEFTPAENLPVGKFASSIQILNDLDGRYQEYGEVPVYGDVVGAVSAFPELIYLGATQVGHPDFFELELNSPSERPFAINEIVFDSPGNDAKFDVHQVASRHTVLLRLVPRTKRSQRETLAATVMFADNSIANVAVPIVYYGL